MKSTLPPNHGVTGLSISQEEVDLFLDYLVESEPVQAKVHENAQETANNVFQHREYQYLLFPERFCALLLVLVRFQPDNLRTNRPHLG